jgi:hypothetical protein
MGDGLGSRKKHKKKRYLGARLFPTQIDDLATEELFDSTSGETSARARTELVIDLPSIEKAPAPLPRRPLLPRRPVANH